MPRPFLILICLMLLPLTVLGAEAPLLFTYKRVGGFAGFNDVLVVAADFTYTLKTNRAQKKGALSAAQQATLKQVLSGFATVKHSFSNGPKVVDGMSESVSARGTGQGKASEEEAKAALRAGSRLVGELSRD